MEPIRYGPAKKFTEEEVMENLKPIKMLLSREELKQQIANAPDFDFEAGGIPDILHSMNSGTTQCPLCGRNFPHEHSAEEIVIYRNGVKYGRSLHGAAKDDARELLVVAKELLGAAHAYERKDCKVCDLKDRISAHLAAQPAEGFVMVPVEPHAAWPLSWRSDWKAMLRDLDIRAEIIAEADAARPAAPGKE